MQAVTLHTVALRAVTLKVITRTLTVIILVSGLFGCSNDTPRHQESGDDYPEKLSQWKVYKITEETLTLNHRVIPYDLNTPLFTDYASKLRTLWIPEGKKATLTHAPEGDIQYPVGTIITKTFYYPIDEKDKSQLKPNHHTAALFSEAQTLTSELSLNKVRLIETRVLIHQQQGWVALPYVWNKEQTDAQLEWAGDSQSLQLANNQGKPIPFTYVVPDANQCAGCHAPEAYSRQIQPLGPKVRHLNKAVTHATGTDNQLRYWEKRNLLTLPPEVDTLPANALWPTARQKESLNHRARSYLDINCSHCHNPQGPGNTSGLFLAMDTPSNTQLGLCKKPIAAGRGSGGLQVAIKPGQASESILIYRMHSTDPGEMMPELGRSLAHKEGIELITQWIDAMGDEC